MNPSTARLLRRLFVWGVLVIPLAACVGPNFARPKPPDVGRYTAEPIEPQTASADGPGGAAQTFLTHQDVPRNWWTLFGSQELDRLVNEALKANPQVRAAQGSAPSGAGKHGGPAWLVLPAGPGKLRCAALA